MIYFVLNYQFNHLGEAKSNIYSIDCYEVVNGKLKFRRSISYENLCFENVETDDQPAYDAVSRAFPDKENTQL